MCPVCSNIEKEEFYAKFSSYEILRWILSFSSCLVRDKVNICVIVVVIVIPIIIDGRRSSNVYDVDNRRYQFWGFQRSPRCNIVVI